MHLLYDAACPQRYAPSSFYGIVQENV